MKPKSNIDKRYKDLDEFYYHEALDRSYLVADFIESTLVEHPVYKKHKDLRKKVQDAQALIVEAYQIIGGLSITLFPDEKRRETPEND